MRDDISNKLVHLTKGTGNTPSSHRSEALQTLYAILDEKRLKGGNGYIKGGHICVCFSEAPIGKLSHLLAENDPKRFKYQPYGIIVDKPWLFEKGGRPVIYGPSDDYDLLPKVIQYRHVSFSLSKEKKGSVDFTWELEWRIHTDSLPIKPEEVTVVVPDRIAKNALEEHFKHDNWHYIVLSDLGVAVDAL